MEKRPSLKKTILRGFVGAATQDKLEGKPLTVFTAGAAITGTPQTTATRDLVTKIAEAQLKHYKEEYHLDSPLAHDEGYFILKDAVVRMGTGALHAGHMLVFYDQVIGVAVGEPDA